MNVQWNQSPNLSVLNSSGQVDMTLKSIWIYVWIYKIKHIGNIFDYSMIADTF